MTATLNQTDEIMKTRTRVVVSFLPMSFLGDCPGMNPSGGSSEYEA